MITTGFWPESIDLFSGGIGFGGLCFFTYLGFVFASGFGFGGLDRFYLPHLLGF